MFALIENNEIKQVGELSTLFPFTSSPTPAYAYEQGAKEVSEGEVKDDRFYWVSFSHYEIDGEMVKRVYTSIPKDLDNLKENWIKTTKETANKQLQSTDWMVIRKLERNIDIPEEVVTRRNEIITLCNNKEAAIVAANTVEELITAIQTPDTNTINI